MDERKSGAFPSKCDTFNRQRKNCHLHIIFNVLSKEMLIEREREKEEKSSAIEWKKMNGKREWK